MAVQDFKPSPKKEYAEGEWEGHGHTRFNRVFGGHRFTDGEVARLLAGDTIEFEATSAKTGNAYMASGCLENQSFTNSSGKLVEFVGFKLRLGDSVPFRMCGHEFTPEERAKLQAGEPVFVEDMVSRKGNKFSATLTWVTGEDGREKIDFSFED